MFERMLDHPNIDLALGADYHDLKPRSCAADHLHGPIDHFFGYRFGPLPYRSLQFRHETLPQRRFQEVAVVNYPAEDIPYTRITEYKHLTGQVAPNTSITYEYPSGEGDPYYPIPRPENQVLSRSTRPWLQRDDVIFLGRLGTYRYYNMDQVVGQALPPTAGLAERMAATQAASSTAAE
jgi:UDP-galactopyranose mutase